MRAERWRVYIKPFDINGVYSDWIEVTDDVLFDSLGTLQQDLDNSDFDIGIYRNSSLSLTLRNEHGRYSDVDVLQSIFRYKRDGSLVKITWAPCYEPALLGTAEVESAILYDIEETEIFRGLLSDESLSMDLDTQKVPFTILGRESILEKMKVPYGSLSNGDLISEIIYTCLNDSRLTSVLSLSALDIVVDNDVAIDDVTKFENKTVRNAVNDLLLAGNSVLYVEGDAIKVSPRTPSASVRYTFYGQGSLDGPENISNIKSIKNGLSRTLNLVVWRDTSLSAESTSSAGKYGTRRKEISLEYFTNPVTQQTILNVIRDEFGLPKRELDLYVPMRDSTLALKHLDRIALDYPIVYVSEFPLPICGVAICGEAILPKGLWSFSVDTSVNWKITGRAVDMKKSELKFKLREI